MKDSIPERDWNVFYQSIVCDRNATEIADEFGLKPGNVRITGALSAAVSSGQFRPGPARGTCSLVSILLH